MSGFSTHQPVFKGGGGPQIICLSKGVNTLCVVGLFLCEKNKNALFSHCSVSTSALSLLYDTPPSPSHSDEHIGEKPGVHSGFTSLLKDTLARTGPNHQPNDW